MQLPSAAPLRRGGWQADDCAVPGETAERTTRVCAGCDGVMVPIVTEAEKLKRRAAVKAKRRRWGRKCRPLPPRKRGVDRPWKEFKVGCFYSEDIRCQHVAFTHHNHEAAGKLLRREADRLRFRQAAQRVAVVNGAPWIREQSNSSPARHNSSVTSAGNEYGIIDRDRRPVLVDLGPQALLDDDSNYSSSLPVLSLNFGIATPMRSSIAR